MRARYYLDDGGYRYGRILYPAAAWLLALGQPGAFPVTMPVINVLAVFGTVFLIAGFLRRKGVSAWWAAVYGFFPGIVICVSRDLTEPLAYFLAVLGFVLVERRPGRALRYAPAFALAALARETTIVFPALLSLQLALQGRAGVRLRGERLARAAAFTAIWFVPFAAYRLLLRWWLQGFPQEQPADPVPVAGHPLTTGPSTPTTSSSSSRS